MNIGLLVCIRGAGERLRPAIERQKRRHPLREIVMSKLRVFAPLTQIPLYLSKEIRFFLPSYPIPNSKTAAVVHELYAAGISRRMIWTPGPSENYTIINFARLLYRLPCALIFIFIVIRRAPSLDCINLQIILGRQVFRQFLHRHPLVMPIIISDVSPDLHMLWSAAAVAGRGALWWQDDYHHIEPLPYPVAAIAVLNQGAYEAVLHSSPLAVRVTRPSITLKPIRPIPDYPKVGIATSNFFIASIEQMKFLENIRQALGVAELYIRLHPNSKLVPADFTAHWITIAPYDESLEQFSLNIDIAVVGNSAVQLRLICEGVPVLHVPGLDPHGYDVYGYCRSGFIYGLEKIGAHILTEINLYYNAPELQVRLADYVSVRDTVKLAGLSQLNYCFYGDTRRQYRPKAFIL